MGYPKDISLLNHHTNFKPKGKGEAVALFNPSGTLIDSSEFGKQAMDVSSAKSGETVGYTYPTPLEKNWSLSSQLIVPDAPTISKKGGFYDDSIMVYLSAEYGKDRQILSITIKTKYLVSRKRLILKLAETIRECWHRSLFPLKQMIFTAMIV